MPGKLRRTNLLLLLTLMLLSGCMSFATEEPAPNRAWFEAGFETPSGTLQFPPLIAATETPVPALPTETSMPPAPRMTATPLRDPLLADYTVIAVDEMDGSSPLLQPWGKFREDPLPLTLFGYSGLRALDPITHGMPAAFLLRSQAANYDIGLSINSNSKEPFAGIRMKRSQITFVIIDGGRVEKLSLMSCPNGTPDPIKDHIVLMEVLARGVRLTIFEKENPSIRCTSAPVLTTWDSEDWYPAIIVSRGAVVIYSYKELREPED